MVLVGEMIGKMTTAGGTNGSETGSQSDKWQRF